MQSLGLDQRILGLVCQAGVDTAMRDAVVRGITCSLEVHGGRLMEVAVQAAVARLTRA